jgi:hypothetical protein
MVSRCLFWLIALNYAKNEMEFIAGVDRRQMQLSSMENDISKDNIV